MMAAIKFAQKQRPIDEPIYDFFVLLKRLEEAQKILGY